MLIKYLSNLSLSILTTLESVRNPGSYVSTALNHAGQAENLSRIGQRYGKGIHIDNQNLWCLFSE